MDIAIFGANGNVGRLVVQRALEQGHDVRAFVHSRDPFAPHDRLVVSSGDVADAGAVQPVVAGADAVISTLGAFRRGTGPVVAGADAVISTLGAFRRGTGPVLAPGLARITDAMQAHGVRRLVVLTGAGVRRPGRPGDVRARVNRFVLTLMDRTAVGDAEEALQLVASTGLDWTAVCAPTITATGPDAYELTEQMPSLLAKVPGPAVAAGLVALAVRAVQAGPVVGIRQAPTTR